MDMVFLKTKSVLVFQHLLSGSLHKFKTTFDSVGFRIHLLNGSWPPLAPPKYLIALVYWHTEPLSHKSHPVHFRYFYFDIYY